VRKAGRLARGEKIKGGCVRLESGQSIGEHSTESGEEFILVIEGEATLMASGRTLKVPQERCVFLPQGTSHDVRNDSPSPLTYLYFVGGK